MFVAYAGHIDISPTNEGLPYKLNDSSVIAAQHNTVQGSEGSVASQPALFLNVISETEKLAHHHLDGNAFDSNSFGTSLDSA